MSVSNQFFDSWFFSLTEWIFLLNDKIVYVKFLAAYDKRSGNVQQSDKNQLDDNDEQHQVHSVNNDRLGDLLDLNSEPAVEDLMRQIMSQAKLWEAIQEANREMVAQNSHTNAKARERFPLTFSAQ